jgi:fucose permease
VAPARVLLACLGVGFIGAVLLVATHDVGAAAAGVYLLGCGCAASFPVVLGFVGDRYARLSGTAFSVVIVMALSGGMLLPYATGELGALHGLRASVLIVPAAFVLMAVLLALATRRLGHAAGAA